MNNFKPDYSLLNPYKFDPNLTQTQKNSIAIIEQILLGIFSNQYEKNIHKRKQQVALHTKNPIEFKAVQNLFKLAHQYEINPTIQRYITTTLRNYNKFIVDYPINSTLQDTLDKIFTNEVKSNKKYWISSRKKFL